MSSGQRSQWGAFAASAIAFLLAAGNSIVNAHEGVHEQIASISGEILMDRGDADLFLRRGELERIGRQWSDAERDFTVAEVLDPSLTVVHLARGRMELDRGNYARARDQLSSYLASSPRSVPALIARAEAHASLHRFAEATEDYRTAIEFSGQPEPDWYLRLSRLQADRGRAEAAVQVLDQGILRLGPAVTLELAAIDLDLASGRVDSALDRLNRIASQSQRQEVWKVRRADILRNAGRGAEARAAYGEALKTIDSLPESQRRRASTRKLEEHVRSSVD